MIFYQNDSLYIESVAAETIINAISSPCYVYSTASVRKQIAEYQQALQGQPHQIFYATKANSTLAILQLFNKAGLGFDIVSAGELARVLAIGGDPKKIVFSGVGKSTAEIEAALAAGIGCFNIESWPELLRVKTIAEQHKKCAPIALRINPDIDAKSHPYISTGLKENKFGLPMSETAALIKWLKTTTAVRLTGLACHIGSQITSIQPFVDALKIMNQLVTQVEAAGLPLTHLNLGGGLGVPYDSETCPPPAAYIAAILQHWQHQHLSLQLEPGRSLIASAGLLMAQVEYLKLTPQKAFCILNTGMHHLIRPALYQAHHPLLPLKRQATAAVPERTYDIVGPICESSDTFIRDCKLAVKAGDYLAFSMAGAYGSTMSSHYNSRPKAAEVLVDGHRFQIIRQPETYQDLFSHETLLSD